MSNIINKMMSNIPSEWELIKREDYAIKNVYVSEAFQIISAYDANGELVVINHYPDEEGFIESYHEQFEEINEVISEENWKDVAGIKPLVNKYIKQTNEERIYLSVFETFNSTEKIAVQIFYEDEKYTIGVSTFMKKNLHEDISKAIKKNPNIIDILNLFTQR